MSVDQNLIERILEGYRYTGTVVYHPSFGDSFIDDKASTANKLPFHYVQEGACSVWLDKKEYHLEQGDLIAIMKGCSHRLTNIKAHSPVKTVLICGYFEMSTGNSQPLIESLPKVQIIRHHDIAQSKPLKNVMTLLIEEVNNKLFGSQSAVNSLAELFFMYLLRNLVKSEKIENGLLAGLSDKQISRALAAFHNNFSKAWSLDLLAKEAGLSRTKFIEKFRQLVGPTPANYMTQWRMNWAAAQLNNTKQSIYNIALSCGYQSDAAFSRVFRLQFGLPPSEYRKQKTANC